MKLKLQTRRLCLALAAAAVLAGGWLAIQATPKPQAADTPAVQTAASAAAPEYPSAGFGKYERLGSRGEECGVLSSPLSIVVSERVLRAVFAVSGRVRSYASDGLSGGAVLRRLVPEPGLL